MSEDVNIFAWITLALVISESYLRANKMWSRKHMQEVAESVSLMAQGVGLLTLGSYAAASYVDGSMHGIVSSVIWFSMTVLMILIGSGFWLKSTRSLTTLQRFKLFFNKETNEVGDLIKDMYSPAGKNYLLEIIQKIALIDNNLSDKEKVILEKVFKEWGEDIDINSITTDDKSVSHNAIEIQDLVDRYLNLTPPTKEVSRLVDLVKVLISADGVITHEEKLISDEIVFQLESYVDDSGDMVHYDVAIVPQKEKQRQTIRDMFPQLKYTDETHGDMYVNERFYTLAMANIYCEEYKNLGLNAVVVVRD